MLKSPDKSIVSKMEKIVGLAFTYKDFCAALDLPMKSTRSIPSQIRSLEAYAEIDIIKKRKPTMYRINKIYTDNEGENSIVQSPIRPHSSYAQNSQSKVLEEDERENIKEVISGKHKNKFQILFQEIIYHQMKERGKNVEYFTGSNLLYFLRIINQNYFVILDKEKIIYLDREYRTLNQIQSKAYKILREWVIRNIERLAEKKFITIEEGYKLYKKVKKDTYEVTLVELGGEQHKLCQRIYKEAYLNTLGGKENFDKEKRSNIWIPSKKSKAFEKELRRLVNQSFKQDGYSTLKRATVITLTMDFKSIAEEEFELCVSAIQEEAIKKIKKSSQFKNYATQDIDRFINVVIGSSEIDLKELYIKNKKERDSLYYNTLMKIAVETGQTLEEVKTQIKIWVNENTQEN